jgi:hypothetical protein
VTLPPMPGTRMWPLEASTIPGVKEMTASGAWLTFTDATSKVAGPALAQRAARARRVNRVVT